MTISYALELLGCISFAISGTFAGIQKRLDIFGVLTVAFVTSIGGGTVRDILMGELPVSWMLDKFYAGVTFFSTIATLIFWKRLKAFKLPLFLFDTIGLGLFTILGVQKGLNAGLKPEICVALGTITGCFGGITRDILLNTIPLLFRKEIYATACIAGGLVYITLIKIGIDINITRFTSIIVICIIRIVAVKYKMSLPRMY
ncbi:trimeric intracellular cation channel family protein [Arcticibacter eurypsychrophilus]|uniref:trimeric intracellular cation channel family protein n=1 Tax=Arcticibacter eurypsychrophilus TaxID=1434752 RepID=UPI00084D4060|nr:trimeric intracellular cation channel family protein [Arcticibacter eurypsychrophilus]